MAFQALLFCPEEKAARAVTQVLGELEFNVESCNEPFATVKKLMGTHFDAIVVDCDNEQNATLLFKSARNSTSNQASLAVAVVEGQAGVARAFRIGANLVLTKPINIEQAKGTLRVARGLLRKGDAAKSSAPATAATATAPSAAAPVKTPATTSVARPATPPLAKPAATLARPAQAATASSAAVAHGQTAPASKDSGQAASSTISPVTPPAATKLVVPSAAKASAVTRPSTPAPSASLSSGAASAPAPAREILDIPPAEASPAKPAGEDDNILDVRAAERPRESSEPAKNVPAPSFTLGAANAPAQSGGLKKILLGIAAAAVVAAGVIAGWMYYQGRMNRAISNLLPTRVASPAPSPSGAQPAPAAASAAAPSSQPAARPATTRATPATNAVNAYTGSASEENAPPAGPNAPKPVEPASSATGKAALAAKSAEAPLVVKGGAVSAMKAAPAAQDTEAPSVIGIAAPASSGPLPNLGGPTNASKPVLQRLSVSQGVSQGLLIKKVEPIYPSIAVQMHTEGMVQLLATISKDGNITQVQVLSGDRRLSAAAVDAVKRWKYKPYLLNGEPVEIQTQISVNFKLPR
jgi:protein TonB